MDPEEILRLGSDAPYLTAQVFHGLCMEEQARTLLSLAAERAEEPWGERAAVELLEDLVGSGLWERAETAAGRVMKIYPGNPRIHLLYAEALLNLKRFEGIPAILQSDGHEAPEAERFVIAALFAAGDAGWEERYLRWNLQERNDEEVVELYRFLEDRGAFDQPGQTPQEEALFACARGRYLASTGTPARALADLVPVLSDPVYLTAPLLTVLERCYASTGRSAEGACLFSALAARAGDGYTRSRALFLEGKLWRRHGSLERAIDAFTLCFRNADTAEDRHRAAWYAADCAVRLSPAAGLASLIHWVTICDDPAWFGDILVSFGSSAVLAGRWGDIGELFRSVGHRMDAETRSFFLFVLSRAYAAGFLVPGPGDSSASFLRRIRAEGGHPYYVLMAAALLGEHLDGPALYRIVNVDAGGPGLHPAAGSAFAADMETEGTAGFPDEPAAAPASSGSGNGARTAVVSRFLAYSLPALAYAEIGGDPDSVSRDVFLETIRSCSRAGLYSEALRLAVRGTKARGRYITPEEIFLLYPRPFLGIVDETSRSEGIPMWLFYALIREESYFSAEVGSSAGAVGLCQLMPSTAADVARRLGIDSYDLTDPGDNVGLGGWYLAAQLRRFGGIVPALWAYNAGPGRAAAWKPRFFEGDPLLAVESVPFAETRNYVHKILVSAALYGGLYEKIAPEAVVDAFFPNLSGP